VTANWNRVLISKTKLGVLVCNSKTDWWVRVAYFFDEVSGYFLVSFFLFSV